jgi:hypothetical protein
MTRANISPEQGVLGALLREPSRLPEVLAIGLRATDFSDSELRPLFGAFESIHACGMWQQSDGLLDAITAAMREQVADKSEIEVLRLVADLVSSEYTSAFLRHDA